MKCKDCKHAIVGKDHVDKDMARLGYKTCELARTPLERGLYFRGIQICFWPDRVKK